jgi:hypothetical protein
MQHLDDITIYLLAIFPVFIAAELHEVQVANTRYVVNVDCRRIDKDSRYFWVRSQTVRGVHDFAGFFQRYTAPAFRENQSQDIRTGCRRGTGVLCFAYAADLDLNH